MSKSAYFTHRPPTYKNSYEFVFFIILKILLGAMRIFFIEMENNI